MPRRKKEITKEDEKQLLQLLEKTIKNLDVKKRKPSKKLTDEQKKEKEKIKLYNKEVARAKKIENEKKRAEAKQIAAEKRALSLSLKQQQLEEMKKSNINLLDLAQQLQISQKELNKAVNESTSEILKDTKSLLNENKTILKNTAVNESIALLNDLINKYNSSAQKGEGFIIILDNIYKLTDLNASDNLDLSKSLTIEEIQKTFSKKNNTGKYNSKNAQQIFFNTIAKNYVKYFMQKQNIEKTTGVDIQDKQQPQQQQNIALSQISNVPEFTTDASISLNNKIQEMNQIDPVNPVGYGDGNELNTEDALYASQINDIMEPMQKYGWIGVYSANTFKNINPRMLSKECSFIINNQPDTDKNGKELPGEHWQAIYINIKQPFEKFNYDSDNDIKRGIWFYDSFGRNPSDLVQAGLKILIEKLINKYDLDYIPTLYINKCVEQARNSSVCAYLCMIWIIEMYHDADECDTIEDSAEKVEQLKKDIADNDGKININK